MLLYFYIPEKRGEFLYSETRGADAEGDRTKIWGTANDKKEFNNFDSYGVVFDL